MMTSRAERRRDSRHKCQIPAVISWAKDKLPTIIQDVSERGMYIGSEYPVPVRQLIKVAFDDDSNWGQLRLTAMVTRLDEENGPVFGVGVELYANSREQVAAWQRLVDFARANMEAEPNDRRDTRRDFKRIKAILEVRVRKARDLVTLFTENISKGGMFIPTNMEIEPGSLVILDLVHPDTKKVMHLTARVVRERRFGRHQGVAVEFAELDPTHREAVWQFVSSTIKF